MFVTKVKVAAWLIVVLGGIVAGVGVLTPRVPGEEGPDNLVQKLKPIKVVSPRDGVILVVGKKLKAGERVEAGQVLARLDDRLAQIEVERARTKLAAAKLELEVSMKTLEEATIRYEIANRLDKKKLISAEEMREKKLSAEKFQLEVGIRKEAVKLALLDIRRAEILLDMHIIRSPVRGVIRVIHINRGEGIKALEPIMEIIPDKE